MAEQQTRTRPSVHNRAEIRKAGLLALLRTADVIRRQLERLFEPFDLTPQQYNVLRILRGARPGSLPTMEIAARMVEQAPGITRLLDRLDAKGLVIRERCLEDRRQVLCSISAAGLELLAQLDAPVEAADERMLTRLADDEVVELTHLLEQVMDGLA